MVIGINCAYRRQASIAIKNLGCDEFLKKGPPQGSYGSPDTCIEVRVDNLTGTIYDIQCIYLGDILSEPVFRFQDFRSDPDLDALDKPFCDESDDAHRLPCIVNVTRDEMQLLFSANCFDPCFYYADGRAQYYYKEKGL